MAEEKVYIKQTNLYDIAERITYDIRIEHNDFGEYIARRTSLFVKILRALEQREDITAEDVRIILGTESSK